MKSKLIAVVLSFIIMIGVTPLVFSALMNKKFDSMLESLKKEGYKISQIEDKSSYLKTDRVFEVVVPGKKIDNTGYVKDIVLKVETVFKNLPVTDVKFFGEVLKIELLNKYDTEILNKAIKDKIKFVVVTPNFKVYKYKVFNNKIVLEDTKFLFDDVEGELLYPKKNTLKIRDIILGSLTQPIMFEVKNFLTVYKKENNTLSQKNKFDFFVTLNSSKLSLLNVNIDNIAYFSEKLKVITTIDIKNADIFSLLRMSGFNLKFDLDGVDAEMIKKLENADSESAKQKVALEILQKGFNVLANLNISHIFVKNRDLGYLKLDVKAVFYPTSNILEKMQQSDFSFLDLKLHLETTPEIATLLMNEAPEFAFLFAFAKKDKNLVLDLEIKKGRLFVNGEEI